MPLKSSRYVLMAMMDVRPVPVDVVGRFMDVLVAVRLADAAWVGVKMMQVPVVVRMRMNGPLMPVGMRMLFGDDEADRDGHQQSGGGHGPAEGVSKNREGGQRQIGRAHV